MASICQRCKNLKRVLSTDGMKYICVASDTCYVEVTSLYQFDKFLKCEYFDRIDKEIEEVEEKIDTKAIDKVCSQIGTLKDILKGDE